MRHYINTVTDPSFNMALDELLLREEGFGNEVVFGFWRNAPSVIIGMNQVVEREVNLPYTRSHGIKVVRRSTGGGAVYHDSGNLNFSFFGPVALTEESYVRMYEIMREAFSSLGLAIEKSPTNDMLYKGLKFSGMAQRVHGKRMLVHGTLLYDVDFDVLSKALDTPQGKFNRERGVKSRHAEVVNLKPYLPAVNGVEDFARRLLEFYIKRYASTELPLSDNFLQRVRDCAAARYRPL